MKEIILYKPNQLIEVLGGTISNLSLLTYNYILHRLQQEKTNSIRLKLSEISSNINRNSNSYEDVYEVLKNLLEIKVISIDKKGKNWGGFSLISAFKKENDCVYIELPNLIVKELLKQEDLYYTTIKLLEENTFKCVYSIIFYEIFKKYEKIDIPTYTLEELKSLTKTEDKYKPYYDFKRRVLTPALQEINKYNEKYIYSFQEEYFGRRVDKIKFIKEPKNTQGVEIQPKLDKSSFSDELLKAIEKARKNRFINDKYSQRAVEKAIIQHGEELVAKALFKLYKFEFTVKSFTKLLNSTVQEIKSLNEINTELKKRETKEDKKIEDSSTPITPVNELSELDSLKSLVLAQAKSQISIEEWSKLSLNLIKIKTKEELEDFIKNYELLINYKLF